MCGLDMDWELLKLASPFVLALCMRHQAKNIKFYFEGLLFTSHWLNLQHWTGFYIAVYGNFQGLFFIFEGSFFGAFRGRNRPEPPCIFSLCVTTGTYVHYPEDGVISADFASSCSSCHTIYPASCFNSGQVQTNPNWTNPFSPMQSNPISSEQSF